MVENNSLTLYISFEALAHELKHSKSNTFELFLSFRAQSYYFFSNFAHELSIKLYKKERM